MLTVGRSEVDLRDQTALFKWFAIKALGGVLAADKAGGIVANNTRRKQTSEPYAIANVDAITMIDAYRSQYVPTLSI